jgi:hypothetical protein
MVLQAKIYEKDGHSKDDISSFIESGKQEIIHPKLKELFTQIIEDN